MQKAQRRKQTHTTPYSDRDSQLQIQMMDMILAIFQLVKQYEKMVRVLALYFLLLVALGSQGNKPVYTQVTFLYDIKRSTAAPQYNHPYQYYLSFFEQMLQTDNKLIIFGGRDLQDFVQQRRKEHNTVFVLKEIQTFKDLWYYPYVEKIRQKTMNNDSFDEKEKGKPQFSLEYYNPIIMAKIYMLNVALEHDKFSTDFFIWTDGGFTHQSPKNIVSPEDVVKKFYQVLQPQWIFFTHNEPKMYLGFENGSERYVGRPLQPKETVLASNFGGYAEILRDVRCTYENLLRIVLQNGDMNSDESVLSLMPIKFPFLFPNTFGLYLRQIDKKFHINMDVNRKPQQSRFFKGDFDGEGNLRIIDNRILTKFVLTGKQQDGWLLSKSTTSEVKRLLSQIYQDGKQKPQIGPIDERNAFYKQIFHRETAFLAAIFIFYALIVCNRPKEPKTLISIQTTTTD